MKSHQPVNEVLAAPIFEDDDVLKLPQAMGLTALQERLRDADWLQPLIEERYRVRGVSTYVDAYSSVTRLMLYAGVLGSRNPDDIAEVSGLTVQFVLVVLVALDAMGWRPEFFQALVEACNGAVVVGDVMNIVEEFEENHFGADIAFIDLLKGLGLREIFPCSSDLPLL